jgi:hypothetical protein
MLREGAVAGIGFAAAPALRLRIGIHDLIAEV